MDINHLRDRIRKETDIERFIGCEGVDYRVSDVHTKTQRSGLRPGMVVVRGKPSQDKILNKMEEQKEDIGIFKIEFILENDDRAEWSSNQVGEEIKRLPYVLRERKMERDAENEDEVIYVGEYAIDKNWIQE